MQFSVGLPKMLENFLKIVKGKCLLCKSENVEIRLISVNKPYAPCGADIQYYCLDCGNIEIEVL